MDFSVSFNRLNHFEPIQMYVYKFAVKSNLEIETCTFILIMSFGTCLFPLKMKQHKHEN